MRPEVHQPVIVKGRIAEHGTDEQFGAIVRVIATDDGTWRIDAQLTPEIFALGIRFFEVESRARAFHVERGGQIVAWPAPAEPVTKVTVGTEAKAFVTEDPIPVPTTPRRKR